MKITCPACKVVIPAIRVNVASDVAHCEKCNEVYVISDLVSAGQGVDNFDIQAPPAGAWFEDTGSGWRVGATTRSPLAFFLVPFTCVWAGGSMAGIYGSQILSGEFSPIMSLFGIPFLVGSVVLCSFTAMSIFGQVVVSVDGEDGSIFEGIGRFGWWRRFNWTDISSVEETAMGYNQSGSSGMVIALVGQSRLKLGSMLTDPRRYYMLQALRTLHARLTN